MYDLDVEGGFKAVWDEKGKGNKAADFFTAFPPLKKAIADCVE